MEKSLPSETYLFEPVFNENLIQNLNNLVNLTGRTSISSFRTIDLRELYLKSVPKELDDTCIKGIAFFLTGSNPILLKTIDWENSIHYLKFDSDLGSFMITFFFKGK
jgi:hypothetical protein